MCVSNLVSSSTLFSSSSLPASLPPLLPKGGGFTSKRGIFGKVGKPVTMLSLAYAADGGQCYSGGADGKVYHWKGNTLTATVEAHKGPVFAIQRVEKVCLCGHVTINLVVM